MTRPVALVTGASGGIGEAIAHVLAEEGEDLVLVARSEAGLERVAAAIRARTDRAVLVLALDLERRDAADVLRARLAQEGLTVRHLVNNAGYGLCGEVAELPREGQLGMIDLNCRALTDLTVTFLPEILATGGGVLNVASVAGFVPGPGMAGYYASKAYVVSLTRALAFELRDRGVKVSALCPGPTPTGFGARAGYRGSRAMALTRPLDPMLVARIGVAGYRKGKLVVVPGWRNRLIVALLAVLPHALVLPMLAKAQRQRRVR
ncbi:SDR family NAD(P)-dependent oxidoreductase [Labrys wisconsinensis]|uniref:Short-subunit dehydrogenase n=1 Tax=Labrys wisconsinensis TaxID=425677 RepID=A0ABU0J0Z3_9HYPH|nr:SDR family oxidoreductase [Labrys wisconsinensis]MDQ0467933.1 short-subunit dehydrogenase [Labrys wisconsinensis]